MKYPEYIMKDLRQRRDLEPNDTSEDNQINEMGSDEVFSDMCKWNGLLGEWDYQIKKWVKDIYGIDLETIKSNSKV